MSLRRSDSPNSWGTASGEIRSFSPGVSVVNRDSFSDALTQILSELEETLLQAHELSMGSGRRRSRVEGMDQSSESALKEGPAPKLSFRADPIRIRPVASDGENFTAPPRKRSSVCRKSTSSARNRTRQSFANPKLSAVDPRSLHNTIAEKRVSEESEMKAA
ncbi:unnamed protein product [Symbiodinium necroappetens]|uniref:Uncharacterized protein n=1 Tax=Symbiodinium necroappetens TaxID=1628268 RepID=A0A813BVZ3_9DINO|nr:unnamed protein product [Symbiodinium necroappetens]